MFNTFFLKAFHHSNKRMNYFTDPYFNYFYLLPPEDELCDELEEDPEEELEDEPPDEELPDE